MVVAIICEQQFVTTCKISCFSRGLTVQVQGILFLWLTINMVEKKRKCDINKDGVSIIQLCYMKICIIGYLVADDSCPI